MSTNVNVTNFAVKDLFFLLLISLLVVCAVGFRPESIGSDTHGYVYYYVHHLRSFEYFFQLIAVVIHWFSLPTAYFFSTIALINVFLILFLGRQLVLYTNQGVELNYLLLLLGISFFVSPFFFAVMVNVLRQGPAILALFIFYLVLGAINSYSELLRLVAYPWDPGILPNIETHGTYVHRNGSRGQAAGRRDLSCQESFVVRANLKTLVFSLAIAFGFHHTSIIVVAFSPLVFLRYRTVFYSVLAACFFYLCGLSEKLLQLFSRLSHIDLYSQIYNYAGGAQSGYHIGRRLDFALFTLAAGMIFNFIGNRFLMASDKTMFSQLVKIYWVLVLPFFFFGFAAYSDRYLLPGWLFLSVLGAVFVGFKLRSYVGSMRWLYGMFFISAVYFILRVQGLLVFKLR